MKLNKRLCFRSPPHFGVITIYVLLYIACIAVTKTYTVPAASAGERVAAVSVFWFLPDAVFASQTAFTILRAAFCVGAACWALGIALPYSCWLATVSFTAVVAFRYEQSTAIAHVFHMANMLMLIHAMWYQLYHVEIKARLRDGTFWSSRLYPRWVFLLCVFYIGLFHSFAGISKLLASGPQWANGLPLQLWVHWRDRPSFVGDLILSNRPLAMTLQIGALVLETGSVLAACSKRLRCVLGFGLLGFYVSVIHVFGYQFHYNAILTGFFFLPFDGLVGRCFEFGRRLASIKLTIWSLNTYVVRTTRFLKRLDLFDIVDVCFRPRTANSMTVHTPLLDLTAFRGDVKGSVGKQACGNRDFPPYGSDATVVRGAAAKQPASGRSAA